MNKYLVEFIGTFFFVATIGFTVLEPGAGAMAPIAIGSVLMVMVYAGGHVSGAHYNPAVTLAVWMRGRCPMEDVIPYMVAQVLGTGAAAAVVLFVKSNPVVRAADPDIPRALLAEFLFTFALCFVILNVATSRKTSGNSYFGLAIGFTVLAGAYAVGGVSGGAFNPAVALGITMLGLSRVGHIWVFLVGNFAGGALAAVAFRVINPDDK